MRLLDNRLTAEFDKKADCDSPQAREMGLGVRELQFLMIIGETAPLEVSEHKGDFLQNHIGYRAM